MAEFSQLRPGAVVYFSTLELVSLWQSGNSGCLPPAGTVHANLAKLKL
jgi:hypothetical protein